MTDIKNCQCDTPIMMCALDKCTHTPEEHKNGICYLCHLPRTSPIISPDNKMSKKEIDKFKNDKGETNKPIIEMSDKKNLLYIAMRYMTYQDSSDTDYMASIIYDADSKTIEMRGRMRYEDTGRKTIFSDTKPIKYTEANLEKKKQQIKEFTELMLKDIPEFKAKEPLVEIEFSIGEDVDSIVQKMNASNRFNIAVIPKP